MLITLLWFWCRYVTPGAFWESAVAFGLTDAEASNWDNQAKARLRLYSPGGAMARELAKNPTVLVVNDVLFCHGGLLPHHVKYGLQRINDEVSQWMMGGENADGSHASPPFPAMGDANSVMWNRTFGKERVTEVSPPSRGPSNNSWLLIFWLCTCFVFKLTLPSAWSALGNPSGGVCQPPSLPICSCLPSAEVPNLSMGPEGFLQ